MKILPIYIAIILSLTPDVILSQILEVNQGTPVFISFENNLPTLGVSLWSSKNDQEIILILDCEDNLKLNPNSNLLIQLVDNQLVNCTYEFNRCV